MSGRRVRIYGRVQGVFFRNWTADKARALGVSGWVRNRLDGSVELVAYGDDAAIEALVAACRTGPPAARVDRVEAEAVEGERPPSGFRVTATA
ncbi:MAG TPA: acylphosphatase [Allosphingosinicella sp.]|nr:acylphosphatase [Allosphingosinicella sp.]